jgi:hypothetical protein
MAYTRFYEAASRSAGSRAVRDFMAEMARRARTYEQLMAQFTEQIHANRARREGKAPTLTRAGRAHLKDAEEAAREAAEQAPALAAQLSDDELLSLSLDDWRMAAEFLEACDDHPDDRPFAERIRRHIEDSLRLAQNFARRRGMTLPKSAPRGAGISFNAAFQRAVPGLGKLGGDCAAIEPALALLDQILIEAGQAALSGFLDPDPERLTDARSPWFDPAHGLASVRLLRAKVPRSRRRIKDRARILKELAALEAELAQAQRKKIRFHFTTTD